MSRTGTTVSTESRVRYEDAWAAIDPDRDASPTARRAPWEEESPFPGRRDENGRRTVTIRGRGSERYVAQPSSSARRRNERRYERAGFQADRAAMWAVLLGVMLILAAAASAHAATLAHLH